MGTVGVVALFANALSFALLWAHRSGDANMRSAWICTRNDVLGNLAVVLVTLGVFCTRSSWPDVIVAAIMGGLALQGAQGGRRSIALRAADRLGSRLVMFARLLFDHGLLV